MNSKNSIWILKEKIEFWKLNLQMDAILVGVLLFREKKILKCLS